MMRFIFLPLVAVALLGSCNSGGKATETSAEENQTENKVPAELPLLNSDSNLTAFASFIAGKDYPVKFKSNRSPTWKNYAAGNKKNWALLDARIGGKIRNWVSSENLELKNEPKTLFYPFAGGDFYYADLFFPDQDTIIMLGLEPCGRVFNPDTANADTLSKYYNVLQHSMFFPHQLGFFRTKSMSKDFNNTLLNGTIHTVLFYLAEAGYNIHYIEYFNLDKGGNPIDITAPDRVGKRRFNGYRIGYSKGERGMVKEVIYFSQDASNAALKAKPGVMAYMEKRNKVVTFFKAASYLMQYERFSTIRDYVISHASRILQDDSGIPYLYLTSHDFNVKLYGKFTGTLNMFKDEFQPSLKEAYDSTKADSLPFLIGYMAPRKECNLQHAVKMKSGH